MSDSEDQALLKGIQRKFPVCNIIDSRLESGEVISSKCNESPSTTVIKLGKRVFDVTLCTGSFNVYVLNIEERV